MSPEQQVSTAVSDAEAFLAHATRIASRTDGALDAFLAREAALRGDLGVHVSLVTGAVDRLARRGGKRLRPALTAAAYLGLGGDDVARIDGAFVALELLQVYFLIHDDWMDQDDVRRGGPTVHVHLRRCFGDTAAGDAAALLAGDLACATAQGALATVLRGASERAEAASVLARMQSDVVLGQIRDMRSDALTAAEVERTYALKTGSYTVDGPLVLGAVLAGATPADVAPLRAFAAPLGVAFQMADDLLGTFGEGEVTGKPIHGDLRQGKRTCLVVELAARAKDDPAARARLEAIGKGSPEELREVADYMQASGVRSTVEGRLADLLSEARARLVDVPVRADMRSVLAGAIKALGARAA